jgi:hypothetical protein
MEIQEQQRLNLLVRQNSVNAQKYSDARQKAAIAKYELDVLTGAKYLSQELNVKSAYEKALILIACENESNKQLYKELLKYVSIYKGLEKVIEANADQLRWMQSRMKYEKENT